MKNKCDKLKVASFNHSINQSLKKPSDDISSLKIQRKDRELVLSISNTNKNLKLKEVTEATLGDQDIENDSVFLPDERVLHILCKGGKEHLISLRGKANSSSKAPYEQLINK